MVLRFLSKLILLIQQVKSISKSSIDFSSTSFVKQFVEPEHGSVKDKDTFNLKVWLRTVANAIVVGEDGLLNEDGLRFDDEFVK